MTVHTDDQALFNYISEGTPDGNYYEFTYLTSPINPLNDSWLYQSFIFRYLNSEPNINYNFRYHPFEAIDGYLSELPKTANKTASREMHKGFKTLAERIKNKMGKYTEDIPYFAERTILHVLKNNDFPLASKEIHSIIQHLYAYSLKKIKETTSENQVLSFRINEVEEAIQTNSEYIAWHTKTPGLETISFNLLKIGAFREEQKAIYLTHAIFEKLNPTLDSIIIGELIINVWKKLLVGLSYDDLKISTETLDESIVSELIHAIQEDFIGHHLNPFMFGEERDKYSVNAEISLSDFVEPMKGLITNIKLSDEPINLGTFYDILLGYRKVDESFVNEHHISTKNIHDEVYQYDSFLFDKDESYRNTITIMPELSDYKNHHESIMSTQHLVLSTTYEIQSVITDVVIETDINIHYYDASIDIIKQTLLANYHGKKSQITYNDLLFDYHHSKEIWNSTELEWFDLNLIEAIEVEVEQSLMNLLAMESIHKNHQIYTDLLFIPSIISIPKNIYTNLLQIPAHISEINIKDMPNIRLSKDSFIDEGYTIQNIDFIPVLSWVIQNEALFDDKNKKNIRIDENVDKFLSSIPLDSSIVDSIYHLKKIETQAWIYVTVSLLSKQSKISLIMDNIKAFKKFSKTSTEFLESVADSENPQAIYEYAQTANTSYEEALYIELINSDEAKLDAIILELIGSDKKDFFFNEAIQQIHQIGDTSKNIDSTILKHPLFASEQERKAIIEKLIIAHESYMNEKEGYVSQQYLLVGDTSDWEDIWNRYTPGVDILDPPDSDFDYTKLANQVYDEQTGIPHKPLGPINEPDVLVDTPLHHPLPEHYDIGLDDSRELPVDNYIFIDVVLAIESLKNRNKLRYAGMAAEKTIRELFSKLFVWIQQAAPGHPEYERMFRFARWYAESVVISMSKHILHREYASWASKFHQMQALDIPYDNVEWRFLPAAMAMQSSSTYGSIGFWKENYIDGKFIIRGYFDNPLNEGTIKVLIDSEEVDVITKSGAFVKEYEVPMGKHYYNVIFHGNSGRASITYFEITGCNFVSAYTTSDDSDTNGLKACNALIANLLAYYEKHHGGGKIKGTMQVKQRRVWNQT